MNHKLKRLSLRLLATLILFFTLLAGIVLNPVLLYAHNTTVGRFTVYHNQSLDIAFQERLKQAEAILKSSELYTTDTRLDICLNDGSWYPSLIEKIQGNAFAYGFYNKVVLKSNINSAENYAELNGYKWNLTQLLAHEMVHNLQYKKLGFIHSNPVAGHPGWKWEGYPEYISHNCEANSNLAHNIKRLLETEKTDNNGWISLDDGTGATIVYYRSWVMMQYCMDQKKMNFEGLLKDNHSEQEIQAEMMAWYSKNKAN